MSIINKVTATITSIPIFNSASTVDSNSTVIDKVDSNFNSSNVTNSSAEIVEFDAVKTYAKINTEKDPLGVRIEPNADSPAYTSLTKGAIVEVIDKDVGNGWAKVRLESGTIGYSNATYLSYEVTDEEVARVSKRPSTIQSKNLSDDIASDRVREAAMKYSDDFNNADHKLLTDHTFMTINDKMIGNSNYTITHIVVDDPSKQLLNIQSHDEYGTGKGGESLYDMSLRISNLVVAATGGFFINDNSGYQNIHAVDENGNPKHGDNHVVIINGEVVDTDTVGLVNDSNRDAALDTVAGTQLICIDKDGKIFNAPENITARQLIEEYHVVNTYVSHETPRVNDGQILHENEDVEWNYSYNRTYLCMTEPGEYYLIQGFGTPENAVNYATNELGCTFVGSLEQGKAVALTTGDQLIRDHTGYNTIGNAFGIVDY